MNLSQFSWAGWTESLLHRVKSEREKQISYINVDIWNLEKRYWLTYLQGRNRDADIENWLVDTVGEGEGGRIENSTETYILLYVKTYLKQLASLKEMGIPEHLTCLLRNLYAGQEAS